MQSEEFSKTSDRSYKLSFDKQVVFEIYTFGEQIVVIPLWEDIFAQEKPSKMNDMQK